MSYKPISNRALSLWAFVAGLEGLLALFFVAREPSETARALVFGLSPQRLVIVIGVLLLAFLFIIIAVAHFYRIISWNESINKNPRRIRYLLAYIFILEILVLHSLFLIPDYHFPILSGYLSRVKPVLIWLSFLLAQTFIFLAYYGGISLRDLEGEREQKQIYIFIILMLIGLGWGLIALTGLGIIPDELYWNVAGVPILAGQIWIGVGATLVAWFLYEKFAKGTNNTRLSSLFIFVVIWVAAALIWVRTPLGPTFNAPGPYPPSRGFYPFVDAALFDLGAQSAIYGKGLFFGSFSDRGLLSGFLALLHRIFGQNYLLVVSVQSAVFAIFPGLLFLLGEKLHSKPAGVMAATLAILKVSNAITGGKFISTSHPKLMLTEFPTGIVLILFSLFLVQWLREKNSRVSYLAGIGATIGIGILLRHNVLFMFPVMFLMGLFLWRLRWKIALRDVLLVVLAFFITISPWMWRNDRVAGEPLFFMLHFNSVIEERYQPESYLDPDKTVSNLPSRSLRAHPAIPQRTYIGILEQYQFIPKHFVHNIITSVLILPPSPVFDDFRHLIDKYPYWDRVENASIEDISVPTGLFLAVNLIILSIGIGAAWKRVRYVAFVPLMVFLFYNLANAFARTSGGRYIVPVDWVIYFYYAIGLVEILRFCISTMGFQANDFFKMPVDYSLSERTSRFVWGKYGLSIMPFFLIVAMLPLLELASPGGKLPETTSSVLETLERFSFFENSGISRLELEEFLENPGAMLISGHGLYPRYYSHREGEPILPGQISPYNAREFPRLVFTLLLPDMNRTVLFPIDTPRLYFPDAAEVIVGGCQVGEIRNDILTPYLSYIDAAFVVILDETHTTYVRVPEAPLICPLREPVCDNNRNCK